MLHPSIGQTTKQMLHEVVSPQSMNYDNFLSFGDYYLISLLIMCDGRLVCHSVFYNESALDFLSLARDV